MDYADDGSSYYAPAYDPPATEQQASLRRHELFGLLPEEITGDLDSVMSVIDLVLDELG